MKRCEYPEKEKWNVLDFYAKEEDFQKSYEMLENELSKYQSFKNHLLDNADSLYNFLNFDTVFSRNLERLYVYAYIINTADTTDTKNQEQFGRVYNLYQKYIETISFATPEILKGDYEKIAKYISEKPTLKEYERNLKEIFRFKKHTLSEKEEKLLANVASAWSTPEDVFTLLTDADLQFGKIKDENGKMVTLDEKTYRLFTQSPDRLVRKNAFKRLYKVYGSFKNTYASLLGNEVKNNNKSSKIRGYNSAIDAALYRNEIPMEVYDNLIKAVKSNIEPLSSYWRVKKNALGVDKLHLYDTSAPIVKEVTKKYTLKEAEELIMKSLAVLGNTYTTDLKQAFTNRWIDFCPNDGKQNGAYCIAAYDVHPYVLLSYNNTLENVSTLIHELGHAMHYYYAIKNQKYQDYNYSIFVAEVASQVNQILLSKYLINTTNDKEEKKYLIDDLIQDFKATIYRQTMFADFEKQIHEYENAGGILTHEVMEDIYYQLNKDYFGKNIVVDKEIKYEYERIPHFYMNFYVYQYATAYAAAIKIALALLKGDAKARDNYLKFLSLGSTMDPIASLKVAGVDMMDSHTLDDAFQYFADLVRELKELLK